MITRAGTRHSWWSYSNRGQHCLLSGGLDRHRMMGWLSLSCWMTRMYNMTPARLLYCCLRTSTVYYNSITGMSSR